MSAHPLSLAEISPLDLPRMGILLDPLLWLGKPTMTSYDPAQATSHAVRALVLQMDAYSLPLVGKIVNRTETAT